MSQYDLCLHGERVDWIKYMNTPQWSKYLEEEHGPAAALAFLIGYNVFTYYRLDDMASLSHQFKNTCLAQLGGSRLGDLLPVHYREKYTVEFISSLDSVAYAVRRNILKETPHIANTPLEQIVLYIIVKIGMDGLSSYGENEIHDFSAWIFKAFGNKDLLSHLYTSKDAPAPDSPYHFDHWKENFAFCPKEPPSAARPKLIMCGYSDYIREQIKSRRVELGMSIEDAAEKAGCTPRKWESFEEGLFLKPKADHEPESSIIKTLRWVRMETDLDKQVQHTSRMKVKDYEDRRYWSEYIFEKFSPIAAISFAAGSERLKAAIEEDMKNLAELPEGSLLINLQYSEIEDGLPREFANRYDMEFLHSLSNAIDILYQTAESYYCNFYAKCVMEELALSLIASFSFFEFDLYDDMQGYDCEGWVYYVIGDEDLDKFLYPDFEYGDIVPLEEDDYYHFNNWLLPFAFVEDPPEG